MSKRVHRFFYGVIEHGKPVMDDPAGFEKLKQSLEGRRFELSLAAAPEGPPVDELTRLRAFFHGTLLPRITRAAYGTCTEEEQGLVKDGLKRLLLCVLGTEGEVVYVRSTEDLSADEYVGFIEGSIRYAAETYADFSL